MHMQSDYRMEKYKPVQAPGGVGGVYSSAGIPFCTKAMPIGKVCNSIIGGPWHDRALPYQVGSR